MKGWTRRQTANLPGPPADPLVLRWLRLRDFAAVAAIEHTVFVEPLTWPQLLLRALRRRTLYLGAWDGTTLAAYFGFEVQGPTAHVISNATHPDYRRRGAASRLLHGAEVRARSLGARWFLGEVRVSNHEQLHVLEKIGWKQVGLVEHFFGNGENAIIVWRSFDDAQSASGIEPE